MINEVNQSFWTYRWRELLQISFHLHSVSASFDMQSLSVLRKCGSIKDVTCVLNNCVHFVAVLMNRGPVALLPFIRQTAPYHALVVHDSIKEGEVLGLQFLEPMMVFITSSL